MPGTPPGIASLYMRKFLNQLGPLKKPLIALIAFLFLWIFITAVLPKINDAITNQTPIVSISATNDRAYGRGEEISPDDFTVIATHESGKTNYITAERIRISNVSISPVGASTAVTVYLLEDESIKCETEVTVAREKVVGFQCGYPEVSNVTAVLYSNGELCFEGEGDVLVCEPGDYPWLNYNGSDKYPITAISFQEGVTPTNMDYWFDGLNTLTYVGAIPSSVRTMVGTFAGCTRLTAAADWSECKNLLNIQNVYKNCRRLTQTCPIPASIRVAEYAYAYCDNLLACADASGAASLTKAKGMYANCPTLVDANIGPAVRDMSKMFTGCINLKEMPVIPDSVRDMSSAFRDDISLQTFSAIPSGVTDISGAFSNCQLLHGEVTIHCDTKKFSNVFSDACVATKINLVGDSHLLDAYANTNEYENVYVHGLSANSSIQDYFDVFDRNGDLIVSESEVPTETTPDQTEPANTNN